MKIESVFFSKTIQIDTLELDVFNSLEVHFQMLSQREKHFLH